MIFVTVGSQKFQFNRLLKQIDILIENEVITEKVFAQIGISDYVPKMYSYTDFMSQDQFEKKLDEASIIITHGGTGVIVNAAKKSKKILGVPRLSTFNEHVDDHQLQLIREFANLNILEPCYDIDNLQNSLEVLRKNKYNNYKSNTKAIIKSIRKFIDE